MGQVLLGVHLDGVKLRVARVRGQTVTRRFYRTVSNHESESLVLQQVFSLIDDAWDDEVAGIGFGAPSVVDTRRGIVYQTQNIPSWREVHLKDRIESRYGRPCVVNNDANAFVLGERYFGGARDCSDVVGLTLGTGFGIGVVLEGRLCMGANCGVGELCHMPYLKLTLEDYCCQRFFDRVSPKRDELFLRSRAIRGDEQAQKVFDAFGRHLGHAVLMVLYAYDPELIILGGSLAPAMPCFEKEMRRVLQTFVFARSLERLQIVRSTMADSGPLGAAALYLDSIYRSGGDVVPIERRALSK